MAALIIKCMDVSITMLSLKPLEMGDRARSSWGLKKIQGREWRLKSSSKICRIKTYKLNN